MRRKPQQARGQRRVNTILDAASEVFSELGYEAATTNIIAIRANTSIGSLYQFFPNKEAILHALTTRYQTQMAGLLNDTFREPVFSAQIHVSTLIDALVEFYLKNPAFRPMFHATPASSAMREAADAVCRQIEENLTGALLPEHATQQRESCAFYAEVITLIMRALIPMIQQPEERGMVTREIKRVVLAYLASTGEFNLSLPGREM